MKMQIKLSPNDKMLTIPIVGRNNLLGYDDNVESIVNSQSNNAINNVSDGEVRRFKPSDPYSIQFQFFNGFTYSTQLPPEFSVNDLGTNAINGSFYLIQLYNTFDGNTQKKYHTGYFNGYDFGTSNINTNYTYNSDLEFTNLYLSQDLINSLIGSTTFYFDFYVRFSFYSAKSGKFYSFSNENQPSVTTEQKLYHKVLINTLTFTYTFNPTYSPIILKEIINADYNTLINNTANSVNIEKPAYPNGNTFTEDGTYITV
jgi:hypothetical protein